LRQLDLIRAVFREAGAPFVRLAPNEFAMLCFLHVHGPKTVRQILKTPPIRRGSVVSTIDRLSRKYLIRAGKSFASEGFVITMMGNRLLIMHCACMVAYYAALREIQAKMAKAEEDYSSVYVGGS
jgi:hypothetical protein